MDPLLGPPLVDQLGVGDTTDHRLKAAPTPTNTPVKKSAKYLAINNTHDNGFQTALNPTNTPVKKKSAKALKKVIGSHRITGAKTFRVPKAQVEDSTKASGNPSSAIMSSTSSKMKTGKARALRPKKRHLVRWSDDMDKKLLLTIQQECNKQNIVLPWTEIGETIGDKITGGAVVQHLAKLRIRMVNQGLPVPPPLKRGGGIKISTGPSLSGRATKASGLATARETTIKKSGKPVPKKRVLANTASDESDDEGVDIDSDSDAEYGVPLAKRTRTAAGPKRGSLKIKSDEDSDAGQSDDDADHKEDTGSNRVVAAGADFLALEDDIPTQNKPKKIVTLSTNFVVDKKSGRASVEHVKTPIKQESPQGQESDSDESDEEEMSRTSAPVADHDADTSNHGIVACMPVSHSFADNINVVKNTGYGPPIGGVPSSYGGLPSVTSLNGASFQEGFNGLHYSGGQDVNAEGATYSPMSFIEGNRMGSGHGYDNLSNQHFAFGGLPNNSAYLNNHAFQGSSNMGHSPYVAQHHPNLPQLMTSQPHSGTIQGHQPSYSAETNTSSSAGPSTVNQTPFDSEVDQYFSSSFDREHDHGMFANEDFALGYGGYGA